MAGTTGLEPATSAVTGQRSNQLSYVPKKLCNYLDICHIELSVSQLLPVSLFLPYRSGGVVGRQEHQGSDKNDSTR